MSDAEDNDFYPYTHKWYLKDMEVRGSGRGFSFLLDGEPGEYIDNEEAVRQFRVSKSTLLSYRKEYKVRVKKVYLEGNHGAVDENGFRYKFLYSSNDLEKIKKGKRK